MTKKEIFKLECEHDQIMSWLNKLEHKLSLGLISQNRYINLEEHYMVKLSIIENQLEATK